MAEKVYQRPLSQREADRCEQAKEPKCVCRCGGQKHGAGRIPEGGNFSTLPFNDPHYRPTVTLAEARKTLKHAADYLRYRYVLPLNSVTDTEALKILQARY